jgi:Holliday junction resolvase-like predicted endonuclease
MSHTVEVGRFWENVALVYMLAQDYKLIATRWKKYGAECDLIMEKDGIGVFIEVKFRQEQTLTAWSIKQRKNLLKVISLWEDQFSGIEIYYIHFYLCGMNVIRLEWMDLQ